MHRLYCTGPTEGWGLFSQCDDDPATLLNDGFDVQVVCGRRTWAEGDEDDIAPAEVDCRWAAAETTFPQVQREGFRPRQEPGRSVGKAQGLNA